MKKTLLAFAIISGFILSGCNSLPEGVKDFGAYKSGTKITEEVMQQVKEKTSKQEDVIRLVGYPTRKEQISGKESWYYDYSRISHVASAENETTVFEFNSKGILTAHYRTNKPANSSNPLLKAAGM